MNSKQHDISTFFDKNNGKNIDESIVNLDELEDFFLELDPPYQEINNDYMYMLLLNEIIDQTGISNQLYNKFKEITSEPDVLIASECCTYSVDGHTYQVWSIQSNFMDFGIDYMAHSCIKPDGSIVYGIRLDTAPRIESPKPYIYAVHHNVFKRLNIEYQEFTLPDFDPSECIKKYREYY